MAVDQHEIQRLNRTGDLSNRRIDGLAVELKRVANAAAGAAGSKKLGHAVTHLATFAHPAVVSEKSIIRLFVVTRYRLFDLKSSFRTLPKRSSGLLGRIVNHLVVSYINHGVSALTQRTDDRLAVHFGNVLA